ncbi:MAG: outer-membrane lipoprotein carrier protein LolA [Planctomycetota bacterium]
MFRTTVRAIGTCCLLVLVVPVGAQEKNEDANNAILDNRVDVLLREWSERTTKIQTLYAEFTRTEIDKVWRTKESAPGSARYIHPNRARLDILGENAQSYVLTGQGSIWEFRPPKKQIVVWKLPPEEAAKDSLEDGPLPFLFGTRPEKAKMRYGFKILSENDKVIHVEVIPKLRKDQQDFVQAEIWLNRQTFLPDRLKFLEANGNEMIFEFKQIWTNLEINPSDFTPKRIDKWEFVEKVLGDEPGNAPKVQR